MAEAKMTTLVPMHLAIPEFAPFVTKTNGAAPSSNVQNGADSEQWPRERVIRCRWARRLRRCSASPDATQGP
jgi:hypothetical protein